MKNWFILTVFIILLLSACGAAAPTPPPPTTPMSFDQIAPPKSGEEIAIIKTNKGVIKIKFFPQFTPETVKNFTELAKKGFYNNLKFHRVIPDFMIQGGDPLGTGMGGETYKGAGTALKAEISSELKHIRGAVSMARKGNDLNSATSQFFIVQNKDGYAALNGQYTIFGQAFEGLDIIDAIANEPRDPADVPLKPVIMESVTVETLP